MYNRRALLLGLLGAGVSGGAMAQTLPFIGGDNGGLLGGAGGPFGGLGGGADGLGGGLGGLLGGGDGFRAKALQDGSYSIQTSDLALQRSRDARVRQFAQLEINEQVSIAAALGAAAHDLPLRPDQAEALAQLQSAPRGSFDRLYIRDQVAAHGELLNLTSAYAQNGGDIAERRVAVVAVPTIQTHLTILHRLARIGA